MSAIFGVLGIVHSQRDFVNNIGQDLIFDAAQESLLYHAEDVERATSIFVKGETDKFKMRWLAPGGGGMNPVGQDPMVPGPAVRTYGEWDVAFPLEEYSNAFGGTRVALASMTLEEIDNHLDTIMEKNMYDHRVQMLTAIFEDTARTWVDRIHGSLTLPRLANSDGVTYPALPGATAEAQDTHYLAPAYTIVQISDTNNPIVTIRDEIVEHFGGRQTGGEDVVILHNSDATPYILDLTDYTPIGDRFVNYGDDTDLAKVLNGIPGRLHGRGSGCWISEWNWIPATFMMGVHLKYPPLLRRVDPDYYKLGHGLRLVATNKDTPMEGSFWSDRFGYGILNRLSAVCAKIVSGSYAPPSAYAE